jgi:hypothetical protein
MSELEGCNIWYPRAGYCLSVQVMATMEEVNLHEGVKEAICIVVAIAFGVEREVGIGGAFGVGGIGGIMEGRAWSLI